MVFLAILCLKQWKLTKLRSKRRLTGSALDSLWISGHRLLSVRSWNFALRSLWKILMIQRNAGKPYHPMVMLRQTICQVTGTKFGRVSDKTAILNCFNSHFISAVFFLYYSFNQGQTSAHQANINAHLSLLSVSRPISWPLQGMYVPPLEVQRALMKLDTGRAAEPYKLEPVYFKLVAFISDPLSRVFNSRFRSHKIPKIWKSAVVLPLLKGGAHWCK